MKRAKTTFLFNRGIETGQLSISFLFSLMLLYKLSICQINEPVVLAYFPSWSETWASTGSNSVLRQTPAYINHVFLAFAKPDLSYVKGSFDISNTGIQTPYGGCTLKESVKVLSDRGIKVILSIGGETYWNSPNAYNISYQQIKDLVDDIGFAGIDWDYEPNGSFSGIGTAANVQHYIDFIRNSRSIMPRSSGYLIACAPSGVGALGGQNNDDVGSPFAYANRNTLTGESDANLYNATIATNGINMFGFSATGHMIPVFAAAGNSIDLVAYQGYNLGASTNRTLMYDAYAHYAEIHGFKLAAGVHFPNEPWGPYYTYTHGNVADLAAHIANDPNRTGDGDGLMIWQMLMENAGNSAYSYLNVASAVLNGSSQATAISNANNYSLQTYSGGSEVSCFCAAPQPNLGPDQSICGLTSILLNTNVSVQSGVSFTWILDSDTLINNSSTENSYTATQPGTYTVLAEEDGCSNSDVIIISNEIPPFSLGADVNICPIDSVILNTGLSDPSYVYSWSVDGNPISGEYENNYVVNAPGTYRANVTASGCAAAQNEISISNNLPEFDLGAPIDLCSPLREVISTGFTDLSYNYVWSLNGVIISGADSSSFLASRDGTYAVMVNAAGCSPRADSLFISSSLPIAYNDTICDQGIVNLNANQNVEWFDSQTGGNLLNTGMSYAPAITTSTTYWVASEIDTQTTTTMRSAFQNNGWQQDPNVYGTKLIVSQDLILDQVTVHAGGGAVTINAVASDGVTQLATTTIPSASGLTTIPLGFALSPGTYYLNTVGSTSNIYVDITPSIDYEQPGTILIEGEAYWDWVVPYGSSYVLSGDYGTFINLAYTTGSSCDRVPITGIIDPFNAECACTAPANAETTNLTPTSATLNWEAVPGADHLEIRGGFAGGNNPVQLILNDGNRTSRHVSGLQANTAYQWQIKAYCDVGGTLESDWSDLVLFTTPAECQKPSNLFTSQVTNNALRLNWNAVAGAESYTIEGRLAGNSAWPVSIQINDGNRNHRDVNGISSGTSYEWRMSTHCSDGSNSLWTAVQSVTTVAKNNNPRVSASSSDRLRVYPNPFSETCTIEFPLQEGEAFEIYISDASGNLINQVQNIRKSQYSINRMGWTRGLYFIEARSATRTQRVKVFIE